MSNFVTLSGQEILDHFDENNKKMRKRSKKEHASCSFLEMKGALQPRVTGLKKGGV